MGGDGRRVFTQARQKSELKSGFIVMEMGQVGAFEVAVIRLLRSESCFSAGAADTTSAQHSLHKSSAAFKISLPGTQSFSSVLFLLPVYAKKVHMHTEILKEKKTTELLDKGP